MKEESKRIPQIVTNNPLFGASQLVSAKAPGTLIEGFLPDKGVVLIAATSHTGKTFLGLEMARAITTGTPFLGKYPAKEGRVLFIEEDSPDWDFKNQIQKIYGWSISEENMVMPDSDPLIISIKQVKWLDNDEYTKDLAYWANENYEMSDDGSAELDFIHGFNLIILDSLSAMHSQDENENIVMHSITNRARLLSEKTNSCVVILHHLNKPSGGESDYVSLQRLRGASAITAAADCVFGLSRRNRFSPEVELKILKNRAFPEMTDIEYYINKNEDNSRIFLKVFSDEMGTTSFRMDKIIERLQSSDEWFDTAFLVGYLMTCENQTDSGNLRTYQNALYRVLTTLEQEEKIIRSRGKVKWKLERSNEDESDGTEVS